MTKKKIVAIVASLVILIGLGIGVKNSLGQKKATVSGTGEIAQLSSPKKNSNASKLKKSTKKKTATKKAESSVQESKKESTQKAESIAQQKTNQASAASAKSSSVSATQSAQASSAAPSSSSTTEKQENTETTPAEPVRASVKVTIVGTTNNAREYLLNGFSTTYTSGDTAFSALQKAASANSFKVAYSGSGGTVYIKGINGLFEFDKGSQSGWLYRVNGVFQKVSASSCSLKNGDVVEWLYTLNQGSDLGAPQG